MTYGLCLLALLVIIVGLGGAIIALGVRPVNGRSDRLREKSERSPT
jgi:hypothetical protein